MKRLLLLAAALAAADPAFAKKKPDWVDGQSSQYPRGQYLTGVGQAGDRTTAEDRARGEISKIFSAQMTVHTGVSESVATAGSGGKQTKNDYQQAVYNDVQTVSKKALSDVNIVENWQDPDTRDFYALAVLDKAKALSAVTDKIADFDKQAAQWKSQLDGATDKLPKVKAGLKLLDIFKARKDLCDELRVLGGGQAPEDPLDEAAIKPQVAKAVSELDVVVTMTGDEAAQIKTGIIKGLNGFGLQAKNGGKGGDILLESSVETGQQDLPDGGWRRAHGTVTISLKDAKTDKVFTQFDLTDRQDSKDAKVALKRLRESLASMAAAKVNEEIASYFENQ